MRTAVDSGQDVSILLPPGAHFMLEGTALTVHVGVAIQIYGGGNAILDAGGLSRLFTVHGELHLQGLTLMRGEEHYGGGLMVLPGGKAILSDVALINCTAVSPGFGHADGGGVYVLPFASVTFQRSAIAGCRAVNGQLQTGAAARGGGAYVLGRSGSIMQHVHVHAPTRHQAFRLFTPPLHPLDDS